MDERYILITCLQKGPIDTTKWAPSWHVDASQLPPHPWSNETIRDLADRYPMISHGGGGAEPQREFMREMIQRFGTCAFLAWEEQKVVGLARFYPMEVARLIAKSHTKGFSPVLDCTLASEPEEDEGTLWVQCVMTCAPYVNPEGASRSGARKGLGLKLAGAVVNWAQKHGWKRIVKIAHCDLDWFYGIQGGGGRAFWEKLGFKATREFYHRLDLSVEYDGTVAAHLSEEHSAIVEAQMQEKGMTENEVWTWYRMACEL